MSVPPYPPMDNPVRGGLQPPPSGHRRSRGVYAPHGQKSLSMSEAEAGPLVPPSDNLPVYTNPQHHANDLPVGSKTHSLLGHARQYSEIPPQTPTFSNDRSAQTNNWDTVKGNGSSLPGLPLGTTTATMRKGGSYTPEQSATLISKLVSSEVIAGILVSATYLVSSTWMGIYNSTHSFGGHFEDESVEFGQIHHHSPDGRYFLTTCTLVSITMLMMGLYSELRKKNQLHPLHDPTGKTKSTGAAVPNIRNTILMTISIGLPFYASLLLERGRVVMAVLLLLVTGISPIVQLRHDSKNQKQSRFPLKQHKGTVAFLLGIMVLDTIGHTSDTDWQMGLKGYIALLLSVFILQPPFTSLPQLPSIAHSKDSTYEPSASDTALSTQAGLLPASAVALAGTNPCFQAGAILAVLCFLIGYMTGGIFITLPDSAITLLVGLLSAISFLNFSPSTFQSKHQLGFISGSVSLLMADAITPHKDYSDLAIAFSFMCIAYIAVHLDIKAIKSGTHRHSHAELVHGHDAHHHNHHHNSESHPSRVTRWLLKTCEHWPFMYGILKEKDSRRIFYFMCLNFGFMLVQLSYGILTGSLGLLSDSIHMLFDCFALAVGLCAAVMSKWPPSVRFPYGYGKVDTLAGFANGVFLMIISIEIVYEAIERLMSGSEVHRIGELFFVSAAGLAVNMVGIMAFDHGHHHGHSHSHGGHDHNSGHPHPHHTNENMHGIFLHILADTLGSVAVVLSTILVHFYKWSGFDPIASCLIAILIFVSAIPLVASTSKTLLLALPADAEYGLRDALAGVSTLRGVVGYSVPKFWLDDTVHDHKHNHNHHGHHHDEHNNNHRHEHEHDDHHSHSHHSHTHPQDDKHSHEHTHEHSRTSQRILGVIHVIASRGADMEDVRRRTISYLGEKDINILVQVEREGENRCWCGGGNKPII